LHWKPDTEHVLEDDDTENDGMHAFLCRFDIEKEYAVLLQRLCPFTLI